MKGIIYYTNNKLEPTIFKLVQEHLRESGLPITSSSQEPIDFGDNKVTKGKSCYYTMVRQIIDCLERAKKKYVFFCEHDVLYHKSHFDFTPEKDDIFYYNINIWRWMLGSDKAVRHDRMLSLSNLCCNRELALEHYKKRLDILTKANLENASGEPLVVRRMGYEPGTKNKKRGGYFDLEFSTWESELPNIDIRHDNTFSRGKISLNEFKHKPKWWKEIYVDKIAGWNLKELL